MTRVSSTPSRRTYRTGSNLPAITTDFRPIPLGRDEQGEPDGQIRAFAVLLRNRSDSSIYIREGPESDDAFEIAPGEDYRIWESNGINSINLRGEIGGETVEVRTLEAHNDFDLTDKIDAFARSISHFIQTATSNTTISGQDIDLSIDDAGGINITGSVDASGSTVDASGSNVVVDDIISGSVDASGSNITVDDITTATATFDVAGSVDVGTFADTVTIDDITATSATFDGDITGQSNFDIKMVAREGQEQVLELSDTKQLLTESNYVYYTNHAYANVFVDAWADGFVRDYWVRFADSNFGGDMDKFGAILQIDKGTDGNWENVTPRYLQTAQFVYQYGNNSRIAASGRHDVNGEVSYSVNPSPGYKFEEGDSMRLKFGAHAATGQNNNNIRVEATINAAFMEYRL